MIGAQGNGTIGHTRWRVLMLRNSYKHDAPASEPQESAQAHVRQTVENRKHTRWRVVLVFFWSKPSFDGKWRNTKTGACVE